MQAAGNLSWWQPEAASEIALEIDSLLATLSWITLPAAVVVQLVLIFVVFRYRRARTQTSSHIHGHSILELLFALPVTGVLVWLAFASQSLWGRMQSHGPAVQVEVLAQQFAWNIRYPGRDGIAGKTDARLVTDEDAWGKVKDDPAGLDDIYTINQMHLPEKKATNIVLRSKDVIHSFFIPNMRIKQDVVPGSTILLQLNPNRTGQFEIACAEFCGLAHYRMRGTLTVGTDAAHEAWMSEQLANQ